VADAGQGGTSSRFAAGYHLQRREGKGPCLTDAAHLTFSRRLVRVLGRYAMIRTCSIALSGFLCGGGVIKTSFARDLSPMATDCNAPPLASDCQAGLRRNGCTSVCREVLIWRTFYAASDDALGRLRQSLIGSLAAIA
jgi:hypothetical protein